MKKTIFYTIILSSLVGTVAAAPLVHAETTTQENTRTVEQSISNLLTIRDNDTLSETERATEELKARKQVLRDALELSMQETTDLIASLENIEGLDPEGKKEGMRNAFIGALRSYGTYYTQQMEKIDSLETAAEVKALAQEIKTYRDTIHNPNVQHIVDFVLLFRNESVIGIAQNRLEKIVSDIHKLERKGFIENGIFSESLSEAQALIRESVALHESAKEMMFTSPTKEEAPQEEINTDQTTEENIDTPSDTETEEDAATEAADEVAVEEVIVEPTARDVILQSFDKIREAYAVFLNISKEVRAMLGLE
jgi:hypothetical protein